MWFCCNWTQKYWKQWIDWMRRHGEEGREEINLISKRECLRLKSQLSGMWMYLMQQNSKMTDPREKELRSNEQCGQESGSVRKSKRIVKQERESARERRERREMKKGKSGKGGNKLQKIRAQQLRRSQQINEKLLEYFSSSVEEYFRSCQQSLEYSMKYCQEEEKEDIRNILKHVPNSIWQGLPRNDKDVASYLSLLHLIDQPGIILQKGDQMAFLSKADDCGSKLPKVYTCSSLEQRLLQKRKMFFPSLHGLIESYKVKRQKEDSVGLDWAEKELILLGRVYFQQKDLLSQEVENLRSRIEQERVRSSEGGSSIDSYLNHLIAKNLKDTFREDPLVDLLNYFNSLEELEDDTPAPPITNPNDFKQFLYKRKPLKGKRRHHRLRSSCSICLSSHYELFNPFWSCRCGLRAHKYCLSEAQMCGRCEYLKMRAEFRHNRPECRICKGKGLMLEKISVNDFAHSFCLFLHGYKHYSQGVFKTDMQAAADQIEKLEHQKLNFKQCKICCEKSPRDYLIHCVCCTQMAHPLCAYLSGSRMEYIPGIGAKHNCCLPIELRSGLSGDRKFKVNYCNQVYKANGL